MNCSAVVSKPWWQGGKQSRNGKSVKCTRYTMISSLWGLQEGSGWDGGGGDALEERFSHPKQQPIGTSRVQSRGGKNWRAHGCALSFYQWLFISAVDQWGGELLQAVCPVQNVTHATILSPRQLRSCSTDRRLCSCSTDSHLGLRKSSPASRLLVRVWCVAP